MIPIRTWMQSLILASIFMDLTACTAMKSIQSKKDAAKKEKEGDGTTAPGAAAAGRSADVNASEEDEGISIPANIAGASLTCALRKEASETDLSQQYGCLLSDSGNGKKIDQSPLITWKSSLTSGLTFSSPDSAYTAAIYHTLLVVTGSSKSDIESKVASTDIIAQYALKPVVVKRLYNVLKPAYEIDDFEAPVVRNQSIDPDRDGPPIDPF